MTMSPSQHSDSPRTEVVSPPVQSSPNSSNSNCECGPYKDNDNNDALLPSTTTTTTTTTTSNTSSSSSSSSSSLLQKEEDEEQEEPWRAAEEWLFRKSGETTNTNTNTNNPIVTLRNRLQLLQQAGEGEGEPPTSLDSSLDSHDDDAWMVLTNKTTTTTTQHTPLTTPTLLSCSSKMSISPRNTTTPRLCDHQTIGMRKKEEDPRDNNNNNKNFMDVDPHYTKLQTTTRTRTRMKQQQQATERNKVFFQEHHYTNNYGGTMKSKSAPQADAAARSLLGVLPQQQQQKEQQGAGKAADAKQEKLLLLLLPKENVIKLHIYDLVPTETIMQFEVLCGYGELEFPIGQCCNSLNNGLYELGTGIYHVGIEMNGIEYAYGANRTKGITGVFSCLPKRSPGFQYRTTLDFGKRRPAAPLRLVDENPNNSNSNNREMTTTYSYNNNGIMDGREIIHKMAKEYMGVDYDLLRKNCCTFAHDACLRLGVPREEIPTWFQNLATAGAVTQDVAYNMTIQPITSILSYVETNDNTNNNNDDDRCVVGQQQQQQESSQTTTGFEVMYPNNNEVRRRGRHDDDDVVVHVVDAAEEAGVKERAIVRKTTSWT